MKSVQRTKGICRIIRKTILRKAVQKYITAGDRACGGMVRETRYRHQKPRPCDGPFLSRTMFGILQEFPGGFPKTKTA